MKNDMEEGRKIARQMMDAMNCCSDREVVDGFMDELRRTHRTLQQAYGKVVIESILTFAEMNDGNWTDARNEAICSLSAKLREVIRENNGSYVREGKEKACLPFI
jgi:hypothetical protein